MNVRAIGIIVVATQISAIAATVSSGFLAFDTLIPGVPGSPGINVFTINNLTGDPGAGGFALPPDFPVVTSVTFKNARLAVVSSSGTENIVLGDLMTGLHGPTALQFSGAQQFSQATFTAEIDPLTWDLSGGGTFAPISNAIVATLRPSSGGFLTAGTDFVVFNHSDVSAIPEPATFGLPLLALSAGWLLKRRLPPG